MTSNVHGKPQSEKRKKKCSIVTFPREHPEGGFGNFFWKWNICWIIHKYNFQKYDFENSNIVSFFTPSLTKNTLFNVFRLKTSIYLSYFVSQLVVVWNIFETQFKENWKTSDDPRTENRFAWPPPSPKKTHHFCCNLDSRSVVWSSPCEPPHDDVIMWRFTERRFQPNP